MWSILNYAEICWKYLGYLFNTQSDIAYEEGIWWNPGWCMEVALVNDEKVN